MTAWALFGKEKKRLVRKALRASQGKIKPAARALGVTVQTLRRWMDRLGIARKLKRSSLEL